MTSDEAVRVLSRLRPHSDLIRFGVALDAAGLLTDGWAYFLKKPWKWADAYMEWDHRDKPDPGDGETWREFVEAVE